MNRQLRSREKSSNGMLRTTSNERGGEAAGTQTS